MENNQNAKETKKTIKVYNQKRKTEKGFIFMTLSYYRGRTQNDYVEIRVPNDLKPKEEGYYNIEFDLKYVNAMTRKYIDKSGEMREKQIIYLNNVSKIEPATYSSTALTDEQIEEIAHLFD